jgi:hypothetical protein
MAALSEHRSARPSSSPMRLSTTETAEGIHPDRRRRVARMAGSFLLRSFGFELGHLTAGTVVLSDGQ